MNCYAAKQMNGRTNFELVRSAASAMDTPKSDRIFPGFRANFVTGHHREPPALIAVFVFLTITCTPPASGQSEVGFTIEPPSQVYGAQVFGDGSRDANPADWPATFILTNNSGLECTATALSDHVLLTAAHCVSNTSHGEMKRVGATKRAVDCEISGDYPADRYADFSLCTVTPPIPPSQFGFESIGFDLGEASTDATITLVGFGCRKAGGIDRGFGKLGEGDAKVTSWSDKYITTGGSAALCLGDSGGGAYFAADASHLQRRLVAINSRGDLHSVSQLTRTGNHSFVEWAGHWAASHNVTICGVGPPAQHCHQ